MRVLKKILKWFFISVFTLVAIGILTAFMFGSILFSFAQNVLMPSSEVAIELETMPVNLSSTLYYKDTTTGEYVEWVTLQNAENREWVDSPDIPGNFKNAFVSIEDQRFWEHPGVDIKRTAAACLNAVTGKNVFGGSTITQQLIKNLTNNREVTIKRKITEICRALRLEQRYTKDEILEWYMNIIYFGHGQYGVGAAAEYYYNKTVQELSLAEMCSLAGITNNPSKYDPYVYPENNWNRRKIILDKMHELGYISRFECDLAKSEELPLAEHTQREKDGTEVYPYYVDAVIDDVIQYFQESAGVSESQASNMLYYGGYQIYTCVDMNIQKKMDDFYQNPENIPETKDGKPLQSSMVVMDPVTGDIVGLEGGVGEKTVARGLNWATSALGRRPPGSSFKPIAVYGPAIDMELVTPNTYLLDSDSVKLEGTDWLPKNSSRKNYGWVTVRYGVVQSLNTIAAQVMDKVTPAVSYDFLVNSLHMNLEPADMDYAPLAVGQLSIGTTTREMASAYSMFPCNGTFTQGRTFSRICNSSGSTICENTPVREPAISTKAAYWMTDILQDAVAEGTGKGAKLSNMPCAGKTGTTTDSKDLWFVGYTPYYVGAVWSGYAKPAKISISGNPSAAIWKQVMTSIHEDLPYKEFPVPNDIELPEETGYKPHYEEENNWDDLGDEPVLPETDWDNHGYGEQGHAYDQGNYGGNQWGWSSLPWIDTDLEQSWTTPATPMYDPYSPYTQPNYYEEPGGYFHEEPEEVYDYDSVMPEWLFNAWGEE